MTTENQTETPRLNGRTGFSVLEKREMLANSVVFPTERKEEFLDLLDDYRQSLLPVGFIEERVVETITVCDWSRRRSWVLNMAHVARAVVVQQQSADDLTNTMQSEMPPLQTALAVGKLADTSRSLEYFRRCDTGYSREYRRARVELKELQSDRAKREERERLSRPPDWDIESCFVHSEEIYERTQPTPTSFPNPGPSSPLEVPAHKEGGPITATSTPAPEKVPERTEPSIPFSSTPALTSKPAPPVHRHPLESFPSGFQKRENR